MHPEFRFAIRRIAVCVLWLIAGRAYAELKLVSAEFLPSTFTAGTRVQIFARLDLGSGSLPECAIKPAEEAPGSLEPTVHEIRLKREGKYYLYTVSFTPWQPGRGALPQLTVGTEIIPAIPLLTASSLEADASLPSPRAQKEPAGVRVRVYLFVGLLLLAVFASIFAGLALPKAASAFFAGRGVLRARKAFYRVLSELEKGADSGPDAWKRLCSALRRYLGFRMGPGTPCPSLPAPLESLTAREFALLPPDSLPGGVHGEVAAILLRSDMVRWAGFMDAKLPQAVRDAREAAGKLDAALSAKQPKADVAGVADADADGGAR